MVFLFRQLRNSGPPARRRPRPLPSTHSFPPQSRRLPRDRDCRSRRAENSALSPNAMKLGMTGGPRLSLTRRTRKLARSGRRSIRHPKMASQISPQGLGAQNGDIIRCRDRELARSCRSTVSHPKDYLHQQRTPCCRERRNHQNCQQTTRRILQTSTGSSGQCPVGHPKIVATARVRAIEDHPAAENRETGIVHAEHAARPSRQTALGDLPPPRSVRSSPPTCRPSPTDWRVSSHHRPGTAPCRQGL